MRRRLMDREASETQIPVTCKKDVQIRGDVRSVRKDFRRRVLHTVAILAILSVVGIGTPQAAAPPSPILTFSILDPVGDQKGTIDVTRMDMTFDQGSGNYTIVLTADTAHPFFGQFRVDINIFNPNAPSKYSFFQDVCKKCDTFSVSLNKGNDFNLLVATTTLPLSGKDQTLKHWNAGDLVATTTWAGLGNPPGTSLFRSTVMNLPFTFLTNEDVIGYNDLNGDGSAGVATIAVSP